MKDRLKLFDARQIDQLPWPNTPDGHYARKFLYPLIKNGVKHYIDNVDTTLYALLIDDLVLPVTVNDTQYDNSYVCSPYGHYIGYALDSIDNMKSSLIRRPLKAAVKTMARLFRFGKLNQVVIVNNWLFSTNLYPKISQEQVSAIRQFLQKHFPEHAILFRSIHTYGNAELYGVFEKNRFDMIASRQVFFMNAADESIFQSRILKSDFSLLKKSQYEVVENEQLSDEIVPMLTELYRSVYLGKHSKLNPQLNQNFMKLTIDNRILHLKALRKNGRIDGVAGYFSRGNTMTSPFLGYDTTQPKESSLYRLTSTLLTQEAREKKMLFNLSSGASFPKKIRKGIPTLEYNAVYHGHLSIARRLPWYFLKGVMNSVGKVFMKSYDEL